MLHKKIKKLLFGEPAKTKVRQLSTLTPEQQRLLNQEITPRLLEGLDQRAFGQVTVQPDQLERIAQTVVPTTNPAMQASLSALEEVARREAVGDAREARLRQAQQLVELAQQVGQVSAPAELLDEAQRRVAQVQAAQLSPEAQAALAQMLSGEPQQFEEFFQKAIQEPALQQFNEQVLPMIARRFAGQFFGSDRERADLLAQRELLRALTEQRARLAFDAQQRALERQAQAVGLEQQDLQRQAAERAQQAAAVAELARLAGQQQLGAGQLELAGQQQALAALEAQTGIDRAQIANLATVMQASGLPLEAAAKAVGLDIQRALANADISRTEFEQALRSEQLGLEAQQLEEARRQALLQILLQAALGQRMENVLVQRGARQGLLQPIAKGFGAAIGGPFGAAIGDITAKRLQGMFGDRGETAVKGGGTT